MQWFSGTIEAGRKSAVNTFPALTKSPYVEVIMAGLSLPENNSETKQCRRCGEVKPVTSFQMRYGKDYRQHTCGMCGKRGWMARDPERARTAKRAETYRRRARANGISVEEYIQRLEEKANKATANRLVKEAKAEQVAEFGCVLKARRGKRVCPIISYEKKKEGIRRLYWADTTAGRDKVRQWKRRNPAKLSVQHYRRRVNYKPVVCDLTED